MRAAFQAFNAGDTGECLTLAAPDLITHLAELSEPQHGRETWRQGFEMMKRAFPDLQAHIEDIFDAGDKVAVRLRFRGTHYGRGLVEPGLVLVSRWRPDGEPGPEADQAWTYCGVAPV